MIVRLLLAILITVFVVAVIRLLWLHYRPNSQRAGMAVGGALLALVLLALIVTGRLHWLFAGLMGLLPAARRLLGLWPLFSRLRGLGGLGTLGAGAGAGGASRGSRANTGRVSTTRSRFLAMELDHDSGRMDGEVIDGPHRGRNLAELTLPTLVALLRHYRTEDPDSARLLETWLERHHGDDWREQRDHTESGGDASATGDDISRSEALAVLGLDGEPSREEIRRAHRTLMQKLHPDHGGSDYLAAKLNLAKDRLLRDLGTSR